MYHYPGILDHGSFRVGYICTAITRQQLAPFSRSPHFVADVGFGPVTAEWGFAPAAVDVHAMVGQRNALRAIK
jgi:hypothetical protein